MRVSAPCAPAVRQPAKTLPKKVRAAVSPASNPNTGWRIGLGGAPGGCSQSRDVEGERSDPAKPVKAWPACGATAVGSQRTVCSRAASGLRFLSLTAQSLAAGPLGGAEV